MAEEKIMTVNLRKFLTKEPQWDRSKQALAVLKKIVKKHTRAENIKIDKKLNERIWKRGIKKPTVKIRIKITKVDEKTAKIELLEK